MDLSRSRYPLASVGSVSVMIQYGTSEKANATGDGTPVIRMNNLVNGELDLRNLKHLRLSAADTARLTLMDGDILSIVPTARNSSASAPSSTRKANTSSLPT